MTRILLPTTTSRRRGQNRSDTRPTQHAATQHTATCALKLVVEQMAPEQQLARIRELEASAVDSSEIIGALQVRARDPTSR